MDDDGHFRDAKFIGVSLDAIHRLPSPYLARLHPTMPVSGFVPMIGIENVSLASSSNDARPFAR